MKYRSPKNMDLPSCNFDSKKLSSKTYKAKLITPIFGGGTETGIPDLNMPIRASEIRGQLRYWWRFLAKNRVIDSLEKEELFKEERRIWGGMGNDKELKESGERDFSSKIFIKCKVIKKSKTFTYSNQEPKYALFPARGNKRENLEPKDLISPGIEFNLEIVFDKSLDFDVDIKPALRWWSCFGGIGARTRRGLGSVEVDNLESVSEKECESYKGCKLVVSNIRKNDAESAWISAINLLYEFRQKPGIGRNSGENNTQGRSRWPEPDSIREITGNHSTKKTIKIWNNETKIKDKNYQCNDHRPIHNARISFPRAYFGLPIIFKFKDENCGEPKQTMLLPDIDNVDKLSSPLILTPYKVDKHYVAAALCLPKCHIQDMNISLKQSENRLIKPSNINNEKKQEWQDQNWEQWTENWWDTSKANDVMPIKNYGGTDALTAFMNFFEEESKT